eukprot:998646-Rhodomonas_salina.5
MSGTHTPHAAILLRACYGMSGTDLAYGATSLVLQRGTTSRYKRGKVSYRPTKVLCDARGTKIAYGGFRPMGISRGSESRG